MDVTLRDGGCVLDFNFGRENMEKILAAQEASGIDMIELGYIDAENGSRSGRTMYSSEQVIPEAILKRKKPGVTYVAMIDYGSYDTHLLHPRDEKGLDGIRLAFHKKDMKDMVPFCRAVLDKGYLLFVQPMVTLRYSDREILELIELVNTYLPDATAFYIVDSFGEMRPKDVYRYLNLLDDNLAPKLAIGLHSHNNIQLSYSNAQAALQYQMDRQLMLDCSIKGMGKGAGNLNTELLLGYLNWACEGEYRIKPLLEVTDQVINRLQEQYFWGYAPEYYLSSVYHCSPSYARWFYQVEKLPIEKVEVLLSQISEDKRISFDRGYAQRLVRETA
jgi:4-hydroxy 2-oxovalerate aldolase